MLDDSKKRVIEETSSHVAALNEDAFQRMLERIVDISLIRNRMDAQRLIDEICGGADLDQVDSTSRAAAWITAVAPYEENAPTLQEVEAVIEDQQLLAKLEDRISKTQSRRDETFSDYKQIRARGVAIRGVHPYFEDIAATVELRGMLGSPMADHIGFLAARYVGVEPIASISIRPDIGEDFKFQIGKDDLQKLINSLMMVDARMEELISFAQKAEE